MVHVAVGVEDVSTCIPPTYAAAVITPPATIPLSGASRSSIGSSIAVAGVVGWRMFTSLDALELTSG